MTIEIEWALIEPPLAPVAVAAHGEAGNRLAIRATEPGQPRDPWDPRDRGDPWDRGGGWRLVRFADWTVVTGERLPWVDGVTYLGALPGTSTVLVPVHHRPRLHPDLVARAVKSLTGNGVGRVALIPHDGRQVAVLPLGREDD